jgi:hypothetical protein
MTFSLNEPSDLCIDISVYRQWSNRASLANKLVVACPLFWFSILGHRLIAYRIQDGQCGPPDGLYVSYDNYFQVIVCSLTPCIVMSILACLLIRSVRSIARRRVVPIKDVSTMGSKQNSVIRQMDTQLTLMLLLECILAMITYLPYAIELTYTDITVDWYKSPSRLAWEKIFVELVHLFSYVFFASSFYVSIISNVGFRRRIQHVLRLRMVKGDRRPSVTTTRPQAVTIFQPNYKPT